MLEELCDLLKHTSLCGLGQSAPNPVREHTEVFCGRNTRLTLKITTVPAGVCGKQPVGASL